MGKKYSDIYPQIYEFENLWLASRKARRGKRGRIEVSEFEHNLEYNLFEIQDDLKHEKYHFGAYREFLITDPKERLINSAPYRDRVVHHAICNIIEPLIDKAMISDSYACRYNKGTHKAIEKAQKYLRSNKWIYKFDIQKYFFTIDHRILTEKLKRKFTDNKLIDLTEKLLSTYDSGSEYYFPFENDGIFDTVRKRGIPIGNLTSQIFANYYLDTLDRYITEDLKLKKYIRYMDDILIFSESKEELQTKANDITKKAEEMRLKIHPKKSNIFTSKNGLSFLGFNIHRSYLKILRPNLQRFKKRMLKYQKNYKEQISYEKVNQSLNAWYGYSLQIENFNLINEILKKYNFNFDSTIIKFNINKGVHRINENRVLRGGSWNNNAKNCRSSNRNNNNPDNENNKNGFRIVNTYKSGVLCFKEYKSEKDKSRYAPAIMAKTSDPSEGLEPSEG